VAVVGGVAAREVELDELLGPAPEVEAAAHHLGRRQVVALAGHEEGGPKELVQFHLAGGHAADYGHTDLLFGKKAPEEVYPVIADWLAAHSRPASGDGR
jgi:hypothetical protein